MGAKKKEWECTEMVLSDRTTKNKKIKSTKQYTVDREIFVVTIFS